MRYPTLTVQATQALAAQRLAGRSTDAAARVHWMGRGDDIDLTAIGATASSILKDLDDFQGGPDARDLDRFEGHAAGPLHRVLCPLPAECLDDPGFWRYLTVEDFWAFVVWREHSAFESGDYGRYRHYIDGNNPTECVLFRTFLRGRLTEDRGTYDLAYAVPFGADFWRSHILRVKAGSAPTIARAFARSHAHDRLATDELRTLARALNRTWTNVVPYTYDDDEADALIAELRDGLAAGDLNHHTS